MAHDKIVNRIINVLEETVVLEEQHKKVVALYILNTYVYENFQFCPLLCITAPTKACGKSTLAEVIGALAKTPRLTMNATPAVIFRLIDRDSPCLIADETEMWGGKAKEELKAETDAAKKSKLKKKVKDLEDAYDQAADTGD